MQQVGLAGGIGVIVRCVELDKIGNGATPRRRWLGDAGKTGRRRCAR